MNEALYRLLELINEAENIVFFGGAGVSTESGIPDFRGGNGLYDKASDREIPPEEILHRRYFEAHPDKFYEYYRENLIYPDAEPNPAHYALAELEKMGKLSAVITQNIDGLHQRAGSKNVFEIHGTTYKNYCTECGKKYGIDRIISSSSVPTCECGGIIRPDVTLYGEAPDRGTWDAAEEAVANADLLIVGGTSLTVYPAASLVAGYYGEHLVVINKSASRYDGLAELVIREPIGEVFEEILEVL